MTTGNRNPATAGVTGFLQNVQLGGFEQQDNSLSARVSQPQRRCRLFNPVTRADALHTAEECNAAAARLRRAAMAEPKSTALSLDRLAARYAGLAATYFRQADHLPAGGAA